MIRSHAGMPGRGLLSLIGLVTLAGLAGTAIATPSRDGCSSYIDAAPGVTTTLATAGTWCLDHDLVAEASPEIFIEIAADDVTVDCRGHRIRFVSGDEYARAIWGSQYRRIVVRNCRFEGFSLGIGLHYYEWPAASGEFLVEDNTFVGSDRAIEVGGGGSLVRRNRIRDAGGQAIVVSNGGVDIVDNLIDGVSQAPYSPVMAIWMVDTQGGEIRGNTIRGIRKPVDDDDITMHAIWVMRSDNGTASARPVTITDNVIVGAPETTGLVCDHPKARYSGNVFVGFAADAVAGSCADAGGNDVAP